MSLFQMEPNPKKRKQIQSYVPTIQDFAIKPKSQIQMQIHPMHPEITESIWKPYGIFTFSIKPSYEVHPSYYSKASNILTTSLIETPIFILLLFKIKIWIDNFFSISWTTVCSNSKTLNLNAVLQPEKSLSWSWYTKKLQILWAFLFDTESARIEHIRDDKKSPLF